MKKSILIKIELGILLFQGFCEGSTGTVNTLGINSYLLLPITFSSDGTTVLLGATTTNSKITEKPVTFNNSSTGYYNTTPSETTTINWTIPATMTSGNKTYPIGIYSKAISSTNSTNISNNIALKRSDTIIELTVTNGVKLPSSCSSLFSGSTSIQTVSIYTTSENVTSMDKMFQNCTGLTSTSLSSTFLSNAGKTNTLNLSYMFDGCTSLTSVAANYSSYNFPTPNRISNLSYMFRNCSSLMIVPQCIKNLDTTSVESMSFMFKGCTRISSVGLSSTFLSNAGKTNTLNLSYMFDGCTNLKSIATDDSYVFPTPNNINNLSYMFRDCTNLETLPYCIKNLDASNVTNMLGMFSGCTSLEMLDLSGFNTKKITSYSGLNQMFYNCTALVTLKAGKNFVINSTVAATNMFFGCNNLQVTLDKLKLDEADNTKKALVKSTATKVLLPTIIDGDIKSQSLVNVMKGQLLASQITGGTVNLSSIFYDSENNTTASVNDVVYIGIPPDCVMLSPLGETLDINGNGIIAASLVNKTIDDENFGINPSSLTLSGTISLSGDNSEFENGSMQIGNGTDASTITFANSDSLPSTQITVNPKANMSFSGTSDYTPKNDITVESGAGFSSAGTVHIKRGNLTIN